MITDKNTKLVQEKKRTLLLVIVLPENFTEKNVLMCYMGKRLSEPGSKNRENIG